MSSGNLTQNAVNQALTGSGYQFAVHGVSTRRPSRRSSAAVPQVSAPRQQSYTVADPNTFDLSRFADANSLRAAFHRLQQEGGPGAGEDGVTYSDFGGTELYDALRQIRIRLLNHDYTPQPTRLVRIPKGDGRFRELQLNCVLDRVVAKALQLALDGYWRRQLPRLGKSVWDVFAEMQQIMRQYDGYVLAVDDIANCFPSAPLDAVLTCVRRHISQPDLLWLTETVVRGHDAREHTTGLHQGSPLSPVAMELLLHTHLDTRFGTEFQGFPRLLRYVDNLNIVCRSEDEGRDAMRFCENILTDLRFILKGEQPPMDEPMDLRMPHPDREVLGMNPLWESAHLRFTVTDSAYQNLLEGFTTSTTCPRPKETAWAVASGWLNALGPALTTTARPGIIDRMITIARECGFTELCSRDLHETGRLARARWLNVSEVWRSHGPV